MASQIPDLLLQTIPAYVHVDIDAMIESQSEEAITSVRMNPLKPTKRFLEEEKVPWCEEGKYLLHRPNFTADPLIHAGCYYVQEASSMFLEYALKQLVDFSQPQYALDLCGAPGGKSTLLASLLNEDSLLLSNEVIQTRASILVENMCKWGRLNTWVSNSDPKQLGDLHHHFDIMLIDAPCSGSGLFRKIPDYIDEWTLDNVHLCAQRQKRILHDSYTALAEDGILVYMTCSFSEAENESIVDYILEEFDVASCGIEMPTEWGIVETISPMHAGAGYRFFPHLLKGEGFFLACFRKKDGFARTHFLPKVQLKKKYESLKTFVNIEGKFFIEQKDQLIMINETHVDFLDSINKKVRLVKKGIMMGKLIRNELIPEHELAMYHSLIFDKKKEITIAEAIDYLKREHIELEIDDRGWYLVTYENVNLGWIKNLGNRINNYYPSNYRILRKNILPSA